MPKKSRGQKRQAKTKKRTNGTHDDPHRHLYHGWAVCRLAVSLMSCQGFVLCP
jgi:hypothetical protein